MSIEAPISVKFRKFCINQVSNSNDPKDKLAAPLVDKVKENFRKVAQTVYVVSCESPESNSLMGITVTSATSVSMSPPILSFNVKLPSRFSHQLHIVKNCAVNMLTYEQSPLADFFSKPGPKKLTDSLLQSSVSWHSSGIPYLSNSLTTFICSTHSVVKVADHEIWMVKITDTVSQSDSKYHGLLYYKQKYLPSP